MPAFTFTSPDGESYTVNGPDGATQGQAFQMLQQQLGKPTSWLDDGARLLNGASFGLLGAVPDKVKGAGEAALSLLTGATGGALGYAGGALGGIAGSIASGKFGTPEGARMAEQSATEGAQKLTFQPRTAAGQSMLDTAAGAINDSGVAAIPYGQMLELANAAAIAKPAVANVGSRVAAAVGNEADLAKAAIGKGVSQVVAQTPIPDIAAAVTPDVNTQALAQKLQAIGGKVPLHTLSQNKFVRMAGETLDNLPLSGSTKPGNKLAFNQELIKQIGGDAAPGELLTPANFGPAMDKSGAAIGDIYNNATIPIDESFQRDLDGLSASQKLQTTDVRNVVNNYIDDIKASADETGAIPGQALRTQDSALGTRIRALPPGDLRNQLSDLQETLRDALARQLSPEDANALNGYRKQYAIGKLLEPLVAKSAFDGVSPQALMGRETATAGGKHRMAMGAAGDIGDLANIGQRFVKEQPSSGTAERGMLVGAALDTGKALAGITAGNLYNRLGPLLSSKIIGQPTGDVAAAVNKDLTLAPAGADIPTTTSPFTPKAPEPNPLLSMAEDQPNAAPGPAAEAAPSVDKPLNQEIFRQREISDTINTFQSESDRLQGILEGDAKATEKGVARAQLKLLQEDFAAKMNGLRSNFYNEGYTKLPVEHGFSGGIGIANPSDAPALKLPKQMPIEQQGKTGFRVKVLSHDADGRVAELMIVPHSDDAAGTLQ